MLNFSQTPTYKIIDDLQKSVAKLNPKESIEFLVLNPDIATSTYSGNLIKIEDEEYIYRGYKSWVDLAHQLHCRMLTPMLESKEFVIIRYEKLNLDDSFHLKIVDKEQKYGADSIFSQIMKNEESGFLHYYKEALTNIGLDKRKRILNLGVNNADEFEIIKKLSSNFKELELVGIDYCDSAIQSAKEKFKEDKNVTFLSEDINNLNNLNLGEFDLIVSVGTLQSSNLEYQALLLSIVQNQLKKDGAIILGFPNCRWVDGEMIYGAKVKNYAFSELGLLYKDVVFAKKYLQQKKFRVMVSGKDYIFVSATSIRKSTV